MGAARNKISFIIIGILTAFVLALFFQPLAADCLSVLVNGWGTERYLAASAGEGSAAVVSRTDDAFRLTTGTLDGRRTGERTVQLPVSAVDCTVAGLYPAADGAVWLGVYERADSASQNLSVYRIPTDGEAERLLVYPCTGAATGQGTFLSGFSEQDGAVQFVLVDDGMAQIYRCGAGSGLQQGELLPARGASAAAVLADATAALGGAGWLELDGRSVDFSLDNCIVAYLTQVGTGLFYIDSASLKVFYCDLAGTACAEVFDLGRSATLDGLNSLSFGGDGSVLLLRDGRTLERVTESRVDSLNGLLYRSDAASIAILAGLLLGWLLATELVWYLLCGRRHSFLPLAVGAGGVLAVCALAAGTLAGGLMVGPMVRGNLVREVESVLAGAAVIAADSGAPDEELPAQIENSLSALSSGDYAAVTAAVYEQSGGGWIVCGGALPAGSRAALSPGFSEALARQAVLNGSAFSQEGEAFCLCLYREGKAVFLTAAGGALAARLEDNTARVISGLWAGIALLWAAAVIVLLLVGRGLGCVSRAMERLSGGNTAARLSLSTGDELEGLAASFNSMARAMQRQEDNLAGVIRAYLRFVPERVLALLGKDSILEVDKRTFASRRMSAMQVWFEFPGRVYDNATRALFESINEVIERTAAIVARKGGTVFNFAYNGYDVVLDGGEADAVSTAVAVQQEVLSLNEQRAIDGLPTVTLRIALDVGEVMIGVVGDENQMEPATISASFTTARHLIGLAGRLDAGILCTENVIAGAAGYGSRYMGKSRQGDELLRVYEIFDGDPYGVRRGKETTGRQFSQGVFALYSHDFAAAKRIFLELVHDHPDDGGARYYLYLADRLASRPEQEVSLEYGI